MLGVLDGLVDEGHDLLHFWNAMIAVVRDLLLARTLPERKDLLSRPPEEAQALIRAAENLSREDLTRIFQVLADLEPGLKTSGQPRYLFEAALIRLASLEMHPLDTEDRIPEIRKEHGSGQCNITRCCTEVCPEHIGITDNAIIPLKERVVDRYYDPITKLLRVVGIGK